jgi:hypothetical protein
MVTFKPYIEPLSHFRATAAKAENMFRYRSFMTRQSLFELFQHLPHRNVILPRFVPAGVFHPLVQTNKSIIYYDVPNDLIIDKHFIEGLDLDPTDTIFYYIHQFGMYIQDNIDLMSTMQQKGYFVIDDRSLTLPVSTYNETADATAYSFYKLIGVPFGGQIALKEPIPIQHHPMNGLNQDLMQKMNSNFYFYANPFVKIMPQLCYRTYNRIFSKYVGYNSLSLKAWEAPIASLPSKIDSKLDVVDFDKVTTKRTLIAKMYYDGLDPSFLLPVANECISRQSMMGFPILVHDPQKALKYLIRRGISTFRFTQIWWWDKSQEPCDLYNRNLLLPAHQGLTHKDIRYIIDTVNNMPR